MNILDRSELSGSASNEGVRPPPLREEEVVSRRLFTFNSDLKLVARTTNSEWVTLRSTAQ